MSRRFKAKSDLEGGFDLSSCKSVASKLPEYNALFDPNMRHFFENRVVQKHLQRTGQIDGGGRVIDLERNKGKLHIIEQEFKAAERIEKWRSKEEEDMRYRVQQKRHAALERARQQEKISKLKEDLTVRKEIMRATRDSFGVTYPAMSSSMNGSMRSSRSRTDSDSGFH